MRRLILLATGLTLLVNHPAPAAPAAVHGTVTTADATALANARVELIPLLSNFHRGRRVLDDGRTTAAPVAVTRTDAAGRFSLAVSRAGIRKVVVRAAGFVPMRYFPLPSSSSTELPPAILLRDAGARITTRDSSGEPVAGAWVLARTATESLWSRIAVNGWQVAERLGRTDAGGTLLLPRAEGEKLHLSAQRPRSAVLSHAREVEQATLVLETDSVSRRVLEVRGEQDEPIPGLLVAVGNMAFPAGRTGTEGTLELTSPVPGVVILHLLAEDGRRQREVLRSSEGQRDPPARFVFSKPVRVTGRVVDAAARQPLAGAVVWPGHEPGRFVLTDAKGDYELVAPPGEPISVQAEAAGFLPRNQWLRDPEGSVIQAPTLALTAAAAVSGQVVDGAGLPLPGVRIEAAAIAPTPPPQAFHPDRFASRSVSDAAGRFTLGKLHPEGSYELTAAKAGFVTARITVARSPKELRIPLEKARPVVGRVVDVEEQPLAGAEVRLQAAAESSPRRRTPATALSDEAGFFRMGAVPAPTVDIEVGKQGFSTMKVRGVEVAPGEGPIDLGTLVLEPGVRIEGRVTRPDGEPLAEAKIWVAGDLSRPLAALAHRIRRQEPDAVTGTEGRFLIGDLWKGQKVHLLCDREGYLPASVARVRAPSSEPIEIVLQPASTVSGEVVDEAGEPVAGARVRLQAQPLPPGTIAPRRGAEEALSATCDDRGGFVFPTVAPGEVEIEASARGFMPSPLLLLEIPEDETVDDLRFVLERGHLVEGLVTNTRGETVAGARIRASRSGTTSGGDGTYRLEGLPLGRQRLDVRHREYNRGGREVDVEPGTNRADFVLEGGWEVVGQVVGEGGLPVGGARVELRSSGPSGYREYRARTGQEGRFTVPRVTSGSYGLKVEKAGYAPTELESAFEVTDGPVEGVEVRLRRGASIGGQIRGLGFDQLAAVRVRAQGSGRSGAPGTVDYQGGYEITDLGPGDWLVQAWLPGGSSQAETRVVIEPGVRRVTRDLEFGNALTLFGRISYRGEPLSDTHVSVTGHEIAVRRSVVTDHQGNYRIEDLEAGRYRMALSHPRELLLYNDDVELWADRQLDVEIATARVSGVVTSAASSRPLANAAVSLLRLLGDDGLQTGSRTTVTTGSEGSFHLAQLTAGRYQLTVHRDGYTPIERTLDVAGGVDVEGLELALSPAEGLDLVVRLASGRAPSSATVGVIDASGRLLQSETRRLAEDGYAGFSTLPAGTWELLISAPGGAATRMMTTVPGELLELVLAPAAGVRVRVPSLVESNLVASLTLVGQDGQPFESVEPSGALRRQWSLVGGTVTVEDVPAGVWGVRVVAADGQRWEGVVATTGRTATEVSLE